MAKNPSAEGIYVMCRGLTSDREQKYPAAQLRFRPAAYGLYINHGEILLGRSRFTGKWDIPGGGVEPWETLEEGMTREFREETGVSVRVERLVDFRESFIAFAQHPFHSLRYYYLVSANDGQTLAPDLDELTSVGWVRLDEIHPEECARGDLALIERVMKTEGSRD